MFSGCSGGERDTRCCPRRAGELLTVCQRDSRPVPLQSAVDGAAERSAHDRRVPALVFSAENLPALANSNMAGAPDGPEERWKALLASRNFKQSARPMQRSLSEPLVPIGEDSRCHPSTGDCDQPVASSTVASCATRLALLSGEANAPGGGLRRQKSLPPGSLHPVDTVTTSEASPSLEEEELLEQREQLVRQLAAMEVERQRLLEVLGAAQDHRDHIG
eukprot:gnl/TRDRNA2_/TRDRNA2_134646_c0_seq1.p1 gnl/TRDRNA2_/TRDRNA2_134646_c0~~gnl/TRDRNA2_/TRDRNA2_134646_c0_seq1.p1  ORF type:complete len:219 (+),score=29.46 gnl/TRDRNA2_/TRDRNA2_134646_c0_seq1:106-762(+)